MQKPGYKTSEFWFTLVSFIFSGLFLAGIIGDIDQKEELTSVVTHAVESIILIAGQFGILSRYLKTRTPEPVAEPTPPEPLEEEPEEIEKAEEPKQEPEREPNERSNERTNRRRVRQGKRGRTRKPRRSKKISN
jgi:hypothetical protein